MRAFSRSKTQRSRCRVSVFMRRPVAPLGALVLAAGRGTRMRSERAKVLHTIAGKALVLWVLDAALELAPERIAVVVGQDADDVRRICERHLTLRDSTPHAKISYPLQREQRGTGDAVRAALPAFAGFAGDVVILYGDVPRLTAATGGNPSPAIPERKRTRSLSTRPSNKRRETAAIAPAAAATAPPPPPATWRSSSPAIARRRRRCR